MPRAVDPKQESGLFKDGRRVDGFRVMGVVAEMALQQTLVTGLRSLRPGMLPATVSMTLDGRGRRDVVVHTEDRERAVHLARHLRVKLHEQRFGVLRARQSEGEKEHDLVLDEITAEVGGAEGLISCELKCRRLWSEEGRRKVREALRAEECDKSPWWQRCLSKQGGRWRGRMVILAIYSRDGSFQDSRADYRAVGGAWRAVWGWVGSRTELPVLPPRTPSQPSLVAAASRPPPSRSERNFPNLRFTTEGGKRVAEVAELLQEMGVPASQPGRACKRLKTRHGFTEADVFERPRRGEKKGGRLQWVGTRAALVKLWVDC